MLKVGQTAPDFRLPTTDGSVIQLKKFRGRKVILYFYPKDNTSGCTKEACSFNENLIVFEKKKTIVIGVSVDNILSHQKFVEKYSLKFSLLSDENKNVVHSYGVWKEKSMYGKKFFGIERTTFVIDELGKIRHIYHKVKVDGHVNDVIEVIDKMGRE